MKKAGHEVFDFRHPWERYDGFHWSNIDERWQDWSVEEYKTGLRHPVAIEKFGRDFDARKWADVCVLVLPCGRSAHAEAGWFSGAGRKVIAYIPEPQEPELMYKLFDGVVSTMEELLQMLR